MTLVQSSVRAVHALFARSGFHPIPNFKTKNAQDAFQNYEGTRSKITPQADTTQIRLSRRPTTTSSSSWNSWRPHPTSWRMASPRLLGYGPRRRAFRTRLWSWRITAAAASATAIELNCRAVAIGPCPLVAELRLVRRDRPLNLSWWRKRNDANRFGSQFC
jgi:hypothetical protein